MGNKTVQTTGSNRDCIHRWRMAKVKSLRHKTDYAVTLLSPHLRMKLKQTVTISLLAIGLAAARAQEVKLNIPGKTDQPAAAGPSAPATAAAPAAPSFTEAQLVEEFGWF